MEAIKEQHIEWKDYIVFINQIESKDELKLLKSGDDPSLCERNLASKHLTAQLAYIKTENDEIFVEVLKELANHYENVVFICDDNNFTEEEVSNFSLRINKVLYQDFSILSIGMPPSNIVSSIKDYIENCKDGYLGKQVNLWENNEENYERFYFFNNMFIKVWNKQKKKHSQRCFKMLSNYIFKITKINIKVNSSGDEDRELELEVKDINNDIFTIKIPAKDKNNLNSFRKILNNKGNFVDFFSNTDFLKVFSQIYEKSNPDITYIYDRPGLIEDKNLWLLADDIIELED